MPCSSSCMGELPLLKFWLQDPSRSRFTKSALRRMLWPKALASSWDALGIA